VEAKLYDDIAELGAAGARSHVGAPVAPTEAFNGNASKRPLRVGAEKVKGCVATGGGAHMDACHEFSVVPESINMNVQAVVGTEVGPDNQGGQEDVPDVAPHGDVCKREGLIVPIKSIRHWWFKQFLQGCRGYGNRRKGK
jgi:hypothetical protein